MEFLKETLGEELYTQFAEKMKDSKIKLADLSGGDYVGAEKFKTLETDRNDLNDRLAGANKTIAGFKDMDVDGIKKTAGEWKDAAEKAQKDADAKIAAMQFIYALERELVGAKARDPRIVIPLIDQSILKMADNGIVGLKEQIETLKESHAYLFEAVSPDPVAPKLPQGTKPVQPDGNIPPVTKNPWLKENSNLAEQTKLYRENRTKAIELAKAAGITLN